jgi:hypothetical protein
MPPHTTENSSLARESLRDLPGLSAEHSGGGFASSPDVFACRLSPRIVDSLHASCRVERETSGLAGQESVGIEPAAGHRGLLQQRKHNSRHLQPLDPAGVREIADNPHAVSKARH